MFSMPTINQDKKPPFVRFEVRPKLNPTTSKEQGRQMYDDVVYVIVMQYGSKDQYEKEAIDWLAQKRTESIAGNYPSEWCDLFDRMFEAFQKGNEMPLHGTPLARVPWLTPARIRHWQGANIVTLEDMATCNEGVLGMVGMGARVERDQARAYIEAGRDFGTVAAKMADLEQKLRDSEQRNKDSEDKMLMVAERLAALESNKKPAAKATA